MRLSNGADVPDTVVRAIMNELRKMSPRDREKALWKAMGRGGITTGILPLLTGSEMIPNVRNIVLCAVDPGGSLHDPREG